MRYASRVGQFSPEVVRLVIDLKQPINAGIIQPRPVAAIKPAGVRSLSAFNAPDPLEKLVAQYSREEEAAALFLPHKHIPGAPEPYWATGLPAVHKDCIIAILRPG